ncbi:MAG TPA: response regulator [Verrucomicrobiales bacterium]|nr:response regulator [Verrucomicrobiales bacterium]
MSIRILSIDDSKMVHMVVSKTLKPLGVEVLTATNGEEGVTRARADRPDLILLDATMPVMDGLAALVRLKEIPETRAIPVVMLSADSGQDHRDKAMALGALNFISKPFTSDSLLGGLKGIIDLPMSA